MTEYPRCSFCGFEQSQTEPREQATCNHHWKCPIRRLADAMETIAEAYSEKLEDESSDSENMED